MWSVWEKVIHICVKYIYNTFVGTNWKKTIFRVKFNRVVVKCLDCKATAHLEHKEKIPLPCIPVKNTPSKNGVRFTEIKPYI